MEWMVLAAALIYAFLNGLHDAPAVLAQVVSTRSMEPRRALFWVAALEFIGAAFFSGAVLKTMSFADLRSLSAASPGQIEIFVLAALGAAFFFNALTWYLGIPSSSSHALFGAMAGAALALGFGQGFFLIRIAKLVGILMFSAAATAAVSWALTSLLYASDISFKAGTLIFPSFNTLSSGALAMLHGANDMPKSLGLFFLACPGLAAESFRPYYVLLFAGVISLGMLFGENRILRTLGLKLFRIRTLQGSGASAASGAVLAACTAMGFPVSFTQVLVGSISGAGTARRLRAVRWEVAGDIVISWMVTLPAALALGYLAANLLAAD